ncbi:MAG: zinc ribbon domain-containing protein [Oscillospiraceae bacterium]
MYCRQCGKELNNNVKFCDNCGTKTNEQNESTQQNGQSQPNQSNINNTNYIDCALAYIPVLFWLPYATGNKTEFARKCSNQGLLLLIFNIILNILLSILSGVFNVLNFVSFLSPIFVIFNVIFSICFFAVSGLTIASFVIGLIKALKGEFFEIPVIGKITIIK